MSANRPGQQTTQQTAQPNRTPSPGRLGALAASRAMGLAGAELRYSGLSLVFYNVVWFAVSLPLITLPPAAAALYVVTREIGQRRSVTLGDFLRAMRAHWWTGWRWGLLNALAAGIIVANLTFYRYLGGWVGVPLIALWIGIALVWGVVQMYCLPVLLEQAAPSLRTALRNALVLSLRHPFYTLTWAVMAGSLILVSILAPFLWALITPAMLAFGYNRAVQHLVRAEQGADPFAGAEPVD